jgi:hypothetical protein
VSHSTSPATRSGYARQNSSERNPPRDSPPATTRSIPHASSSAAMSATQAGAL